MKLIYSVSLLIIGPWLVAQDMTLADSLFESKKYTEANEIYESIYLSGQSSPAMLMRMAFIQEGLDNYADALFYLNQYYALTANKKALEKMRKIAEDKALSGYEYSDLEFFRNLVFRHQFLIITALGALSILMMALIYRGKKQNHSIAGYFATQVVLICFIMLINNDFFMKQKAIIDQNQTLVMSGPSAGSELVEMIGKGHRVSIREETDAWVRISWQDGEGYIRKNRLRAI